MVKRRYFKLTIVTLSLIFLANAYILHSFAADSNEDGQAYMKFDSEDLEIMAELFEKAPRADIDTETVEKYMELTSAHFDLLSHLNYVPADRNQGWCGNCWVWAGTGIVEVALDVQEGIYDRLSTQYFDSCWTGGWACCGGFLSTYADWTEADGYVIPWSNTNAHWQDISRTCADGSSLVSCGSIATTPQYGVTKCDEVVITTHGVGSATAIANIKSILHSNKAVWFAFYLTDFDIFRNHWNGNPETATWIPPAGYQGAWGPSSGAHAVLCVGYDDTDEENPYWIVVNSWGTTGTRPNGIFRLSMNMDYDGYFYDGANYYSYYFETLDVAFDIPEPPPVGGAYTTANKLMTIAPWVALCGTIAIVVVGVKIIKKPTL